MFNYGQRHRKEVKIAVKIAKSAKVPYQVIKFDLPWKGSALLDKSSKLSADRSIKNMSKGIPPTYVPGRNTIFLSFALSYAEAIGAKSIFIGANAVDFSGYPDCRPKYYEAFRKMIKAGARDTSINVLTPLIKMSKSQIIRLGMKYGAPLSKTWSCYKGGKTPCGICDSCLIRKKGFEDLK
jgi:7-cyano-7-deazaguanine synthase